MTDETDAYNPNDEADHDVHVAELARQLTRLLANEAKGDANTQLAALRLTVKQLELEDEVTFTGDAL